jgi:NADH-quinone oxidoreductase subunit M
MIAFLIFWPLVAAVMLFIWRPQQARVVALVAALIEMVISFVALSVFDRDNTFQFVTNLPWISSIGIHFYVAADGISMLLVILTTVLVPLIILSAFDHPYPKPHAFYALILFMQMALIGVFTARDGFLFYVFWELALIPIYFICLIWGGTDRARITLKFFIYTLAGSLLMLVGLIFLYLHTPPRHSFNIHALYLAGQNLPANQQGFYFWMFFIAFAIKMPIFPFHTWQPDTYTTAPTQGTMLLSGIMLKMGIYGLIRWLLPVLPVGVHQWAPVAIALSVIGIVYASAIALVQQDFKRLIAYSSIAHVGLIAAGVMTLTRTGIQGAIIQMLSHGIVVFGLFYVVDILFTRAHTREISGLGGIRSQAPMFTTAFTVIMLGSVALPLTSGFIGEFLLISSLVKYRVAIGAFAGLTIIFGAVYMFRAFRQSMLGEPTAATVGFSDLSPREKIILFPTAFLILAIGLYPGPVLSISEMAVDNIVMLLPMLR